MYTGMIFIDGRNFETSVNKIYSSPTNIDYEKLTKFIGDKIECSIKRTYYYTGQGDPKKDLTKYQNTERFVQALNNKDKFIAKKGRLQFLGKDITGKDIISEKQTDVNIATDMISLAYNNSYDFAVLFSADTDYIPVLDLIRQLGKLVVICVCENQKCGLLKPYSDIQIILTKDNLDKLKCH